MSSSISLPVRVRTLFRACQLGIPSPDTHVLGPGYSLDLHVGRCVCGLCGEVVGVGAVVVGVSVSGVVCSGGDCEGRHGGGGGARQRSAGRGRRTATFAPPLPACPVALQWRRLGSKVTETRRERERERKHITYSKPLSSVYLPSETLVVYPGPR
jgi:hypothetical protein